MIRLVKLFWDFAKADFHATRYFLILLWATLLLIVNYSINMENGVIDILPTNGLRFGGYLLLYSTSYYVTVLIISRFQKDKSIFRSHRFWMVSAAGLIIFSIDSGFVLHAPIIAWIDPPASLQGFIWSLLSNGTEFITIALPLFLVNKFFVSNSHENLGVNKNEIDFKPFFLILIIITPFIFVSAFESGLSSYYPTFRYPLVAEAHDVPKWIPVALYEFLYGLNFFNVELTFRGFFVIGMTALLGRSAVLPMAVFYCAIHFGKPAVEAISSLFGGYILGAITYQTRSIWGGVIVHIGLAWIMEVAGAVVKSID